MGKGVTKKEVSLSVHWNPRKLLVEIFGCGKDFEVKPMEFGNRVPFDDWTNKERFKDLEPMLVYDGPEKLQGLFDDMWRMGLRPTEKADGYKAELTATKEHLKDMRNIVFKRMTEDL